MPTTIKVFGNIKDVSRFAKRCTVEIKLINGPINEDPNLIVPTELVRQTDETGYFEAPLGLGNYRLLIGGDQILFSVTDLGSGDKNIVSLLNDDLSYTRDPYNSNWNGLRQGNIQFLYVAAPKDFDGATFDSGGAHLPGLDGAPYRYFCTFITALGETPASPFFDIDLTGIIGGDGNCVRLTFNVADVIANVTKRRVWRSTTDEFQEFQVIAELDPKVATFDDVLPYGGYPGGVAPAPDHNTTAGAIYASNVKVAQVSPESGFDFPFRVLLPYGQTLAYEREATIDLTTDDGVGVPLLRFRKNAGNWAIGKVFTGFNQPGIVPNPATGYGGGTRFLCEDGTWQAPTGGSGDFMADGSVPMTGDLDMGGNAIGNVTVLSVLETLNIGELGVLGNFNIGGGSDDGTGFYFNFMVGTIADNDYAGFNVFQGGGQTWFFGTGSSFGLGGGQVFGLYDITASGPSWYCVPGTGNMTVQNDLTVNGEIFAGTASFAGDVCNINAFGQIQCGDLTANGNVVAGGNFECNGSDGISEDVTVLVTALGLTTVLHFVGGIYIGRD